MMAKACVNQMRREGVSAIPRTCPGCGLGPCNAGHTNPDYDESPPAAPPLTDLLAKVREIDATFRVWFTRAAERQGWQTTDWHLSSLNTDAFVTFARADGETVTISGALLPLLHVLGALGRDTAPDVK